MGCTLPIPASNADTDGFTYGLIDIMRRLGQAHHDSRWQIPYMQGLIADFGFPRALPVLVGTRLTDEVTTRSRWPQVAVDQWLLDRIGPDACASADQRAARVGAEIMDERAKSIGLLIVQGGRP